MSEDNGNRLRPTVMPIPVRGTADDGTREKPRSAAGVTAPVVLQPTAIPGTESRRLEVDAEALRRLTPGTGADAIERARLLLCGFVVEKASERKAILWQQDLQKAYSIAVGKTLALAQSTVLARTQGHVARMLDILSAFDFAGAAQAGGTIGRVLKQFNRRTDTAEEFAVACQELERLKALLEDAMDPLLKLREDIAEAIRTEASLATDIEAAALAALYLSNHLKALKPDLADRYLERSMSLSETLAQIRSNRTLHVIQAEHPVRLVNAIQKVTLVALPDFLVSLAAANSLYARNGSINPTEALELQHKLQDVIQLLNH